MSETQDQRSRTMKAVRSHDTAPELAVRSFLRELGFPGYRLHRKDLPGKPDVAYIGRRRAIFIHGCFWHGHDCERGSRKPKSNRDYWLPKIERNRQRDKQHLTEFREMGWRVLTIWECELHALDKVAVKFQRFLEENSANT